MSGPKLEEITSEFEFAEIHYALRQLTWMLKDEATHTKHRAARSELSRARSDLARAVAVMG